jgi:SAM-dependent methyltransferase
LKREDFKDKLVLDCGCGFGRFAYHANKSGAEVVGVDLSLAVESAYKINKDPFVHIVQGDIYNLPIKPRFDIVYSIGVLQHIPKRKLGYLKMSELVKKGSLFHVVIYAPRKGIYKMVDVMRKVTTNMPFRMLQALCFFLGIVQFVLVVYPYRVMKRIPFLKKTAENMPYTRYSNYPFRHCYADWFDRLSVPLTYYFSRDEVNDLLASAGLHDTKIVDPEPNFPVWRVVGKK